jgi:hypothetical protein
MLRFSSPLWQEARLHGHRDLSLVLPAVVERLNIADNPLSRDETGASELDPGNGPADMHFDEQGAMALSRKTR